MPLYSHTLGGHLTDYRSHIFSAPGVIGFDGALISRCSLDDDIQLYRLSSGVLLSFHYLRTGGLMSNSPTWEQRSPWSQNVPLDAAVRGFHSCLLHAPALLFLLSAIYWPLLPLLTKHKTNTTSIIEPYFTRCGFFQILQIRPCK